MAQPQLPENFDVNDPDTYATALPRAEWTELRRTAPVWWQSQPVGRDGFQDEGHWVVSVIHSTWGYYQLLLNAELPPWPKTVATQICKVLAEAGAYLGDARDREVNDHNHEAASLHAAFTQFEAWRGRSDADYEANGSRP